MAKINIEGTHIRWFVIGALVQHSLEATGSPPKDMGLPDGQFQHQVSDTCNRVHKYLTTEGREGAGGGASDIQCRIAINARTAFGVQLGDAVEVFW